MATRTAVSFAPLGGAKLTSTLGGAKLTSTLGGATLTGALGDTMVDLLDAIVAADGMMASTTAYRARLIDEARSLSELGAMAPNSQQLGTDGNGGWDSTTVAHRELVTELACALRLPERSAETLIAHSSILAASLPAALEAL